MEENNITKKSITRSAAYPSLDLESAIEFTRSLSGHFTANQVFHRGDVAAVLDKSEGAITRDVAACVHYGLLDRPQEGYQISSLFKEIVNPINEQDLKASLVRAFENPKLFQELIEKFNSHAIPAELKTHLVRFHSISEKVSETVADIFVKSARYAKVLSDKNILNLFGTSNEVKQNSTTDNGEPDSKYKPDNPPLLPPHVEEKEEKIPIRLTDNKRAYLIYPPNLTSKDIKIIRKQIDVLEVYISDEE